MLDLCGETVRTARMLVLLIFTLLLLVIYDRCKDKYLQIGAYIHWHLV